MLSFDGVICFFNWIITLMCCPWGSTHYGETLSLMYHLNMIVFSQTGAVEVRVGEVCHVIECGRYLTGPYSGVRLYIYMYIHMYIYMQWYQNQLCFSVTLSSMDIDILNWVMSHHDMVIDQQEFHRCNRHCSITTSYGLWRLLYKILPIIRITTCNIEYYPSYTLQCI